MTPRSRCLALLLPLLAAACSGAGEGAGSAGSPAPAVTTPPTPSSSTVSTDRGAAPSATDGIYGEAQADGGRRVFGRVCSECHYSSELQGGPFQAQWGRRTVGDLYEHVATTMPEDAPGSLTPAEYLQVVAYILRLNDFPSGARLRVGAAAFGTGLEAPSGGR